MKEAKRMLKKVWLTLILYMFVVVSYISLANIIDWFHEHDVNESIETSKYTQQKK